MCGQQVSCLNRRVTATQQKNKQLSLAPMDISVTFVTLLQIVCLLINGVLIQTDLHPQWEENRCYVKPESRGKPASNSITRRSHTDRSRGPK